MSDENAYALGELDRRLANIARVATISALDEEKGLVQVDFGEHTSDWLQWGEHRAGPGARTWSMPEIGEQVMIHAPGGDLSQAVVGQSIYQTAHNQPANLKTTHRTDFGDGAFLVYDRVGHHWALDVPSGGSITLHIGGTTLLLENGQATLTTPQFLVDSPQTTFTGDVTVQGDTDVQAIVSRGHDISSTHHHLNSGGPGIGGVPQ